MEGEYARDSPSLRGNISVGARAVGLGRARKIRGIFTRAFMVARSFPLMDVGPCKAAVVEFASKCTSRR